MALKYLWEKYGGEAVDNLISLASDQVTLPVVEETEEESGYPKLSGKRPSILLNKDAASSMKTILSVISGGQPAAIDMIDQNGPVLGLSVTADEVYIWSKEEDIKKVLAELEDAGIGTTKEKAPVVYSAKNHFKLLPDGLLFDHVFDVEIAGYVLNSIEGADPSFEMLVEHGTHRPFPILEDYGQAKDDNKKASRQQDLFALIDGTEETSKELTEDDVLDFSYRVLLVRWLSYYQKADIQDQGIEKLIYEIEMPLVMVLDRMERRGVLVDVSKIDELHKEFDGKVRELEKEIYELAGEEFTILSPKQLGKVLFDKLGLPSGKKLASGGYSTNSEEP